MKRADLKTVLLIDGAVLTRNLGKLEVKVLLNQTEW
jgi:hypothetical protein